MKICGIYEVTIGDKKFIGAASNVMNVIYQMRYQLKKGIYSNEKMQNVYNELNDFTFEILALCDVTELAKKLTEVISEYDEEQLFNVLKRRIRYTQIERVKTEPINVSTLPNFS